LSVQETSELQVLMQILKWVRFASIREAKAVLGSTLDTDQKKTAYQASDGTLGTREVARISGYGSKSSIEVLWKTWLMLGLGESTPVQGGGERFKHSFDLEDFGISVIGTRPASRIVQTSSETS